MICNKCGRHYDNERFSATQRLQSLYCSRECGSMKRYGPAVDRFKEAISPEPNSGCWLWTKWLDKNGYGQISSGGKLQFAHRFSYSTFVGPILSGYSVCHTCDVPACVNPDHLFQATHKENMKDMATKGRAARYEKHGSGRLTKHERDNIIALRSKGVPVAAVSEKYQVSRRTIRKYTTNNLG